MSLALTFWTISPKREREWNKILEPVLEYFNEIQLEFKSGDYKKGSHSEIGQILILDSSIPNIEEVLELIPRESRIIILAIPEKSEIPKLWSTGQVDDVLVVPFRPLEVLSKLRQYKQMMAWAEVMTLNHSISSMLKDFQEDLKLAEILQKSKLPKRFTQIQGFQFESRYFAGMKSGGDYFDIAESKDKKNISLILTHSNSYSLNSAFLSALMRVTMSLNAGQLKSKTFISEVVKSIHGELLQNLKEKDQLSFFYGFIDRVEQRLRFINLGNAQIFYAPQGQSFRALPRQGESLSKEAKLPLENEYSLELEKGGRLILISEGFLNVLHGKKSVLDLISKMREADAVDLLNEVAFQLKSRVQNDLPEQDCTLVTIDIGQAQVLRLAEGK